MYQWYPIIIIMKEKEKVVIEYVKSEAINVLEEFKGLMLLMFSKSLRVRCQLFKRWRIYIYYITITMDTRYQEHIVSIPWSHYF